MGKTLVSIGLCLKLKASYWKPIQTGEPGDEDYARSFLPEKKICPSSFRLKAPLSPNQATRLEKKKLQVTDIVWPKREDFLVVEGIGGVFVPLNEKETLLDLMNYLKLPVIVTASSKLGTLNHTLLTLEALRKREIPVLGLILSGPPHPENKKDLEHWGQTSVLLELKSLPVITKKNLLEAFEPLIWNIE